MQNPALDQFVHQLQSQIVSVLLLCAVLKISPARGGWDLKDVLGAILIGIFGICSGVVALSRA
jgi:hypothetical protein